MLDLPGVTLCCIDTANHALALRALALSRVGIRFGRTVFLTDSLPAGDAAPDGVEVVSIPPLESRDAYSQFVLKLLPAHIATSHVLLVQWDGYVINPAAWDDAFLACDYIGAKWSWHEDGMRVGNGGFSLRSRKLLEALQDPHIVLRDAEDETICRTFRPLLERDYGIHFGSEELADRFSFEVARPTGKTLGFHGLFNFCHVVPPDELSALVPRFTPEIARSMQFLSLGRNCAAMGQWRQAAVIFGRILDENPASSEAASSLALARAQAAAPVAVGRNEPCPCGSGKRYKNCHGASDSSATGTSAMARDTPDARVQRAVAMHQHGDVNAAERVYREILAQDPGQPVAQHYLGVIHYQRGDLAGALPLLEASTARVPHEPEFHNNLGLAFAAADRSEDAIAAYRRALALKPDHAVALNNLGLALQSLNLVDEAIDAYRRSLAREPGFAQAHWNLSLALLLKGDFAEGWSKYDWRLRIAALGKDKQTFPGPAWDGAAPQGRTLLLYTEQGLGDAIQFARYATLVARAGARPVIHCTATLRTLLASVEGVAAVHCPGEPLPRYDAHLPLMSLPRVFATTMTAIPASVPYLSVAADRRATARAALGDRGSDLKIGLAWAGSGLHGNDRNRSMALAHLMPLFEIPGVAWQSLQQGPAAIEIAGTTAEGHLNPLPSDLALLDTAARVCEFDLVISVDTSMAHLAGALGRPLWVLLPYAPDWRWMLGRDDSPWYPTARLFRQSEPRDWAGVVARVAQALAARIRESKASS